MKPAAILLFLALAIPASAHPHPLRWARSHKLQMAADALIIGASALDAVSTRSAVRSGNYEVNPLYGIHPGVGRLVLVKAAFAVPAAVGIYYLGRRTSDEPHWKRAEILIPALILAIPQIWAAHHNWTLHKAQ